MFFIFILFFLFFLFFYLVSTLIFSKVTFYNYKTNFKTFSTKSLLTYDKNYTWYSYTLLLHYMKILIFKKISNLLFISLSYFFNLTISSFLNLTTNFIYFLKPFNIKTKNHPHQIIPYYNAIYFSIFKSKKLNYFFNIIQKELSFLPFYYSIVISIASLFFLFFIFLHKSSVFLAFSTITPLNFLFFTIKYIPTNFLFILSFYFSLFFYIILLVYNFYKFIYYLQQEIKCKYIYNKIVENQYLFGIILFILSEFMLFFSFFWAFFQVTLSPSIFIGNCWPPVNIITLNPWHIPFLNTIILLTSGITVNWFFFTLKRLTYINYKSFFINNLTGFSLNLIYFTVFNFWFLNIQLIDLKNYKFFYLNWFYNSCLFYFIYSYIIQQLFINFFLYILHFFLFLKLNTLNLINNYYKLNLINLFIFMSKSKLKFFIFKHFFFFSKNFNINQYKYHIKYYKLFIFVLYNINYLFIYFFKYQIHNLFFSLMDNSYLYKLYFIKSLEEIYISLSITIYLGFLFLGFQYVEYKFYSTFDIDNIYGTVFYLLTSLHGLHVFLGLTSLLICYSYFTTLKFKKSEFNKNYFDNFLLIFTVWYWHFVDVVWLFLFIFVYLWGTN